MFKIFNKLQTTVRGTVQFPRYNVYREGQRRNVDRVCRYYSDHTFAVPNSHLLVRLIDAIPIPLGLPVEKYVAYVDDLAYELASSLRITNPYQVGRATATPWFYGGACTEYPLALNAPMGLEARRIAPQFLRNPAWAPVRVLRHPRNDYAVLPLDGRDTGAQGIVVYQIDIPLLALGWREFALEQAKRPAGEREGSTHFVARYVLPRMLYSHVDVSFFNRVYSELVQPGNVGGNLAQGVVAVTDQVRRLDELIAEVNQHLDGRKMSFAEISATIPAICETNILDILRFPDVPLTRQVRWLLFLAQFPMANLLQEYNRRQGGNYNRSEYNQMLRDVAMSINDGGLQQGLTKDSLRITIADIKTLRA